MKREKIERRWRRIRGQEVMLDADAAALYRVSVKAVRAAVGRNPKRFPEDFIFRLSPEETFRLQGAAQEPWSGDHSSPPLVFTLPGFMMLSGVLRSDAAVRAGIMVVRMLGEAGLLPTSEVLRGTSGIA